MKKAVIYLFLGVFVLGGWASPALADESKATHTVFVEFGTTTW